MVKEGSNPMQGYHRQKRQKEVKKNKSQRIKVRDERVIQTKTIAEVQEEIRNIKKRKNLQASELQKLQRLEKELKLVKEAADARPKEPLFLPSEQQTKPLTELDDPRKSVYYDERMNPYGAPPPGKPRLYHQRGGGVTMDIRYAAVPGEEPPPPPPPPPRSAAQGGPRDARPDPRDSSRNQYVTKSQVDNTTSHRDEAFRKEESSLRRQHMAPSSQTAQAVQTADKARDVAKPLVTPNLPAPSKAVLRSRRGNASVDVWASTEEVEYERLANHVDLEADDVGAAAVKKTKQKTKKPPLEIYYQDRAGQVQGPFPKAKMLVWMAASFFPPTTMVKTNRNDAWIPIDDLPALKIECPAPAQKDSVEDRVAALKHADSVEDRIAALRAESGAPKKSDRNEEAPGLRDDLRNVPALPPPPELSQGPPPYDVDNKLGTDTSVNSDGPPPYPTVDDYGDGQALYSDEDDGDNGAAIAPYPQMDEELPAYPVDEDLAYPTDMAYPIAEGDDDDDAACYPVTEPYHALDQPQGDDGGGTLPPSGPLDGDGVAPMFPVHVPASAEPIKIVKVDKELLTLLPSHLQSRKRKAAGGESSTKPLKKVNSHSASTCKAPKDDVLDKYLEEIESLDG